MQILYDTSIAIALRDGSPPILERHERSDAAASISVVTMMELEGGVARTALGREQRRAALDAVYENFGVLAFTSREAMVYGQIVHQLGLTRSKIIDRMIAATALTHGLHLATLNPRDFRAVAGLQLEAW